MGLVIYFSWKYFTNYLVTWCETLFDAVIVDVQQNIVKKRMILLNNLQSCEKEGFHRTHRKQSTPSDSVACTTYSTKTWGNSFLCDFINLLRNSKEILPSSSLQNCAALHYGQTSIQSCYVPEVLWFLQMHINPKLCCSL